MVESALFFIMPSLRSISFFENFFQFEKSKKIQHDPYLKDNIPIVLHLRNDRNKIINGVAMNSNAIAGARHRLVRDTRDINPAHLAVDSNQVSTTRGNSDGHEQAICLCDGLINLLSETLEVPSRLLRSTSRCNASVARARQIGMYLAHVSLGLTMAQVASGFARNKSTVVHACHTIEDLRDDEDFDAFVARQERIINIITEGYWDARKDR